jgi:hypothetical protein
VDRDEQTDDLPGSLVDSEELIRQEQLDPSESRESELEEMRELLLERIRAKTRRDG